MIYGRKIIIMRIIMQIEICRDDKWNIKRLKN